MEREIIHILCATDAKYASRLGVTLLSLFDNNRSNSLFVHVFVNDIHASIWKEYRHMADFYGQQLEIIEVPLQTLLDHGAFELWYFSYAIYYRLLAPELLASDVRKVIYLDGDIIVNGDVRDLWDIDVTNHAMSVCSDSRYYMPEHYERVHNSPTKGYFNSGVLVMNLDYWRTNNISQKCLDYLKAHKDEVIYMDQDVMNAVLINQVRWMPYMFNFQVGCISSHNFNLYDEKHKKEILNAYENPLIIHYLGPSKPWHIMYHNCAYERLWRHYQWKSPWPWHYQLGGNKRPIKFVNSLIKHFLWLFGLGKRLHGYAKEIDCTKVL